MFKAQSYPFEVYGFVSFSMISLTNQRSKKQTATRNVKTKSLNIFRLLSGCSHLTFFDLLSPEGLVEEQRNMMLYRKKKD